MSDRSSAYRPEIDGLRAFAVLPVILFHAGVPGFTGGFVGVDVFFVISGYLITNLLMAELEENGQISILGFYERRARRLIPALIFMLALVSASAYVILWPALLIEYGINAAASAVFLSNVSLWLQGGYFAGPGETNALLHTWSLAVEEQYYILLPPAIWFAWWLGRRQAVIGMVIVSIAASLVIAELGTVYAPTANYYLLPSRVWELMIGAFASLLRPKGTQTPAPLRDPLGWLGLGLIAGSVVFIDKDTPFPGIWAIPPTLGTALILVSAGPGTMIGRLLTLRVFVFFGLISYSLYLWHQPLLALYRVQVGDATAGVGIALTVVVSILMGWASYRFVEKPFRNKGILTRNRIFLGTFVSLASVGMLGMVFVWTLGAIDRYPAHLHNVLAVSATDSSDYVHRRYTDEVLDRAFSGEQQRVLLIGDSFSQDFYNLIRESNAFQGYQISADYISARCQLHLDGAVPAGALPPNDVRRCATWDNRLNNLTVDRAQEADIIILAFSWRDWAVAQLPQTLKGIDLRPKTEVIVIGSKFFPIPTTEMLLSMTANDLRDFRAPLDTATRDVNATLALSPVDAEIVNITDLVCETPDACRAFSPEGEVISYDNRHLTRAGAKYLGGLLFAPNGPLARFGGKYGASPRFPD